MSEVLTKDSEILKAAFQHIGTLTESIDLMTQDGKPNFKGERYLTDNEVSIMLKVSRRTLQDYRNEGVIPYIPLGGKMLYKESDILKMLEGNYRLAYK